MLASNASFSCLKEEEAFNYLIILLKGTNYFTLET